MVAPLAILQARLHSTRLEKKMLLQLGGHPMVWWSWDAAVNAFGAENVLIACPLADFETFRTTLFPANIFGYPGVDNDVLGRLTACARLHRTEPTCPIWRITPDDWPPILDRDLTTLAQLTTWHETVTDPYLREHVGYLFHPDMPIEINTAEDLAYAERRLRVQPD